MGEGQACELAAFAGAHFVVKLGGAAVDDPAAAAAVFSEARACAAAGIRVVLVHGGGKRLTALMERLGLEARFVAGRRVTDPGALEAAKLVLAGGVATDLAAVARRVGLPVVAFSGVSAGLVQAERRPPRPVNGELVDFGAVGDVTGIDPRVLSTLLDGGLIPLVSTLGADAAGQVLNINADTIAACLAKALPRSRLFLLTDVDGVLGDSRDPASRIPSLGAARLKDLAGGAARGGMLPKLESVSACLAAGVEGIHIASWRTPRVLASCALGHDVGTHIAGA